MQLSLRSNNQTQTASIRRPEFECIASFEISLVVLKRGSLSFLSSQHINASHMRIAPIARGQPRSLMICIFFELYLFF